MFKPTKAELKAALEVADGQKEKARQIYNEQLLVNPAVLGTPGKIARDGIINVLEAIFGDDLR